MGLNQGDSTLLIMLLDNQDNWQYQTIVVHYFPSVHTLTFSNLCSTSELSIILFHIYYKGWCVPLEKSFVLFMLQLHVTHLSFQRYMYDWRMVVKYSVFTDAVFWFMYGCIIFNYIYVPSFITRLYLSGKIIRINNKHSMEICRLNLNQNISVCEGF